MENVSFKEVNIKGANFSGAYMIEVILENTDLSWNADFNGIHMPGQNFRGLDLTGINLQNAFLKSSNFENANLTNANLRFSIS